MQDKKTIFLADECVFYKTVMLIREMEFEVITIQDLNLAGIKDPDVLNKAQELDAVLITNDKDFSDIYDYPPSIYKGIIVLKMKPKLEVIIEVHNTLLLLLGQEKDFKGKLFIVDDKKYRIKK
jgi:hypothetical protein